MFIYRFVDLFLSLIDPVHETRLDTDVLFVLDSSYEVSQNDFKIQKDFVKSILRNLDIAPDGSRAAAITYGDQASYASRFIDLQSFEDFDKAVDDASYVGGERRIDRALRMGNRLLKEAKEESSKVVIFLTGGRQASTGESLLDITEPMRMAGVKTVVVAVGKKTDAKELRPLVVVPQDVLSVKSFENLQSQTKQVSGHISERAGKSFLLFFSSSFFFFFFFFCGSPRDFTSSLSPIPTIYTHMN